VFNVRAKTQWAILAWPTFRAAFAAKRYFLTALCLGCKQVACIDLRAINYHPDASINCLIPAPVLPALLPKSAIRKDHGSMALASLEDQRICAYHGGYLLPGPRDHS
jgi:hypothetical protein